MAIKPKRRGFGLEVRSFKGEDGHSYIVYKTSKREFHVFVEVEAKEAARQCGATREGNTQRMWRDVWGPD